jgi:hypothetical protein
MRHLLLIWAVMAHYYAVVAPSKDMAKRVTEEANKYQAATERVWTGQSPPPHPCIISIKITNKPWGWTTYPEFGGLGILVIDAEGTEEEIFDVILPHEVAHTVIASYFGFDIPRWLDEGVATSMEKKSLSRLDGKWGNTPLSDFFPIYDYPKDWKPFYGQCHSVTKYLVETYGRDATYRFASQGIGRTGYARASHINFHISLKGLDREWRIWHAKRFGAWSTSSVPSHSKPPSWQTMEYGRGRNAAFSVGKAWSACHQAKPGP